VVADNSKLRGRAAGIVARITGAEADKAAKALTAAEGEVKAAVLIASGAASLDAARAALKTNNDHLRGALDALRTS